MIRYADVTWDRMILAVEKVRERLTRAVRALEAGRVPYAVIGDHAVAAWVARVDVAAVRNAQDVELLLRRDDLAAATNALGAAGFIHRHVRGIGAAARQSEVCAFTLDCKPPRPPQSPRGNGMFLDGPGASVRDAVHIIFASERVRPDDPIPAPDVTESEALTAFRLVDLEALVRMKLTAFRDKDRTHLRDMLELGLIDASWCDRLPTVLADRLRHLLATPEG